MFKKILIANRGEIACRVIRTARSMGIATVAVYSDADRDALHVEMADEAVHIGAAAGRASLPARSTRSSPPASRPAPRRCIPATASCPRTRRSPTALEEEGIVFIGPHADAIAAMGDKIASKKLARRGRASTTVPGQHRGRSQTPSEAVDDRARDRLPGDDQGVGRRRRQGHARRPRRRRGARGLHALPHRGASELRRRPRLHREVRRASRATSRSRCSATRTATSSTWASASARSSAATRR